MTLCTQSLSLSLSLSLSRSFALTYLFMYRPFNVLKVAGLFSLGEVHAWVRYCLPDVPDQPASEDTNTLYFKSTFIDTFLECTYKYVLYRCVSL